MRSKIILRVVIDVLIAVGVIQGWWFLALPLGLVGAWSLPYFFEIVIAGFIYDALYGMIPGIGVTRYLGTILSVIALLAIAGLKKVVRR